MLYWQRKCFWPNKCNIFRSETISVLSRTRWCFPKWNHIFHDQNRMVIQKSKLGQCDVFQNDHTSILFRTGCYFLKAHNFVMSYSRKICIRWYARSNSCHNTLHLLTVNNRDKLTRLISYVCHVLQETCVNLMFSLNCCEIKLKIQNCHTGVEHDWWWACTLTVAR